MKRIPVDPPCPNAAAHTPAPSGYVAWHLWAEEMGRTHTQAKCPGCGRYQIWKPTPGAPDLPPVEYRLDHKSCMCCDGEPACTCKWHRPQHRSRPGGQQPAG